jgi:hypothetical protein
VARRFTGLLAASMVPAVMLLATACGPNSSSTQSTSTTSAAAPSPSTSPSATASGAALTVQQIMPLFLQCLVEHNVTIWDKARGNTNLESLGKKDGWYENGRVVANQALYTDADALEGFYPVSPDFKPDQTIATWLINAAAGGTWPKVCTPLPSAS